MKILVLQIEDRDDPLLNKFMKSNEMICKQNDMEYIFLKKSLKPVPPYWAKVYEIHRLMNEKKDIDYILWVDSDAFFVNFTKERLLNFLNKYKDYSFIGTPDIPPWTEKFNAGVFVIKNDQIGKAMVDKWVTYYHKNVWNYNPETQKWKTDATWAGVEYEQGSFSTHILEDPNFSKKIILIPYYYLNNHNCGDHQDETLLVHLAGAYKKDQNNVNICSKKLLNDVSNSSNEGFANYGNIILLVDKEGYPKALKVLLYTIIIIFVIILIMLIFKFTPSITTKISKTKLSKITLKHSLKK